MLQNFSRSLQHFGAAKFFPSSGYKLTYFQGYLFSFLDYDVLLILPGKQTPKRIPFQTFSDFRLFPAYKVPLK